MYIYSVISRKFSLLFLVLVCCKFIPSNAQAEDVKCERVGISFLLRHDWVKTCFIDKTTIINSQDLPLNWTVDDKMIGLSFYGNNKISYLPKGAGEKFPNLLSYAATYCSIKGISRENFKGLSKLIYLGLNRNQIEKISSNTFADLGKLEKLELGRKFIKI